MANDGAGRFTATADGNNFQHGTAEISNVGIEFLAPDSGSTSLYIGFMKANRLVSGHPVNLASINVALWFFAGTVRVVLDGALNATVSSGWERGVKGRARVDANGTLTVYQTNPQTGVEALAYTGGVPGGGYIPVVLIVARDGTVRISKVTNA